MPKLKKKTRDLSQVQIDREVDLKKLSYLVPNSEDELELLTVLLNTAYPELGVDENWGVKDIEALSDKFKTEQLPLNAEHEDYYVIGDSLKAMYQEITLKDLKSVSKLLGARKLLKFLGKIELLDTGENAGVLDLRHFDAVVSVLNDAFRDS